MGVAETILEQLGGASRLRAMIGAADFVGDTNSLQFRFRKGRNGATRAIVTLDPSDTYTVRFCHIGRGYDVQEKGTVEGVYADNLRDTFARATGLYLSI